MQTSFGYKTLLNTSVLNTCIEKGFITETSLQVYCPPILEAFRNKIYEILK